MLEPWQLYDRYDREYAEEIKHLPVCCECGEHIQQEKAVHIAGDWYCDQCLDDHREFTE